MRFKISDDVWSLACHLLWHWAQWLDLRYLRVVTKVSSVVPWRKGNTLFVVHRKHFWLNLNINVVWRKALLGAAFDLFHKRVSYKLLWLLLSGRSHLSWWPHTHDRSAHYFLKLVRCHLWLHKWSWESLILLRHKVMVWHFSPWLRLVVHTLCHEFTLLLLRDRLLLRLLINHRPIEIVV